MSKKPMSGQKGKPSKSRLMSRSEILVAAAIFTKRKDVTEALMAKYDGYLKASAPVLSSMINEEILTVAKNTVAFCDTAKLLSSNIIPSTPKEFAHYLQGNSIAINTINAAYGILNMSSLGINTIPKEEILADADFRMKTAGKAAEIFYSGFVALIKEARARAKQASQTSSSSYKTEEQIVQDHREIIAVELSNAVYNIIVLLRVLKKAGYKNLETVAGQTTSLQPLLMASEDSLL